MSVPLVSIALRSYNQKEFLRETLDSILQQTFTDYEIIVADDASKDGSQEMILEYKAKYPDKILPVLAKKNGGHTINMNRALSNCKGKYISIFDGDDLMLPDKLKVQVQYMEQHPECVIAYHNLLFFDDETKKHLYLHNTPNNSFSGTVSTVIKHGMFLGNIATLTRREQLPDTFCDQRITVASDWLFYVDILAKGGQIHYIDQVLAHVRSHKNSVTKTHKFKNLYDQFYSGFIIMQKYPKYSLAVIYRWFAGFFNQVFKK